mmetsp:Transcript_5155/g.15005  ORF Transcript_5155/g.15005 Transcript_5155/m.15005 type:complete len:400 (-) Transcript_5155:388-1587(-)
MGISRIERLVAFVLFLLCLDFAVGFTSFVSTTIGSTSKNKYSPRVKRPSSFTYVNRKVSTSCREKPSWLDDAMKGIPSDDFDAESYKGGIELQPGIAGFSIDSHLGFVCILVADNGTGSKGSGCQDGSTQYWIPVVISPVDTDRPKSVEALTCVQLAGGLDLGTAVLPPDSLAKMVAEHSAEAEDTDNGVVEDKGLLPTRLSLTKIVVMPNPESDAKVAIEEEMKEIVATTPEREQSILDSLPKVEKAVKTLPGLQKTETDSVLEAMQQFADPNGAVDRNAFSCILESLRLSNTPSVSFKPPLFHLEVSVIDEDGISQVTVDTNNSMIALGLAMRYKVMVEVGEIDGHKLGGNGVDELLERFPAFRPIQELDADSRIIDGFIPSMFEKERNLDNDMKGE